MSNLSFEGKSLEDLRSTSRAISYKIDSIRINAATILGILPLPEGKPYWSAAEIDWDDSQVDHLRETYFELMDKLSELTYIIGKLEAEATGELTIWNVDQQIKQFLKDNFNSFEEEVEFFKKNNLVRGTSSLRENLLENPNFLEEVIL